MRRQICHALRIAAKKAAAGRGNPDCDGTLVSYAGRVAVGHVQSASLKPAAHWTPSRCYHGPALSIEVGKGMTENRKLKVMQALALVGIMLSAIPVGLSAKTQSPPRLPPIEDGWKRITAFGGSVGVYDIKMGGVWRQDIRLWEPKKALAACLEYGANPHSASSGSLGCELFLYPSSRELPQAAEALGVYEKQFEGAQTPAARLEIALRKHLGVGFEIQKSPTPEVLNHLVSYWQGSMVSLGELVAYTNDGAPEIVQWLFDHGAKICDNSGSGSAPRFSCINFYINADNSSTNVPGEGWTNRPFLQTLAVLERNGYHPHSANDIELTANALASSPTPSIWRLHDLFSPGDWQRVKALAASRIAANDAAALALRQKIQAQQNEVAATNQQAAARLGVKGQTVCRIIYENGENYQFRAYVEDRSATRLQLRAASLRNFHAELANYPYADTRISPGTIFWDDAGNWNSAC
ncbi:extracellular solute-binding lipoprotein [Novosphingobium nitrogenifigens DSM 19370]|uniref:Extracellular solute-binding lipoprotein n=1 Tax=Novosphingobium nitrogenifigens DSM 19370 TaxID=983920 RepID=F1Z687_9SPHN|nr:hypothetical protein [Novosphingobium nitrogenifigens]EGD59869.1 extracellular solute-binding lipoprotein [Novosphingobium nitrogenifigens DSM 19370]